MRDIAILLAYCAAIVVGGALLAPPLWAAGQWAIAIDLLPQLRPFAFEKYFNRAALVVALALLPAVVLGLDLRRPGALGLRPNPRRWHDLLCGLALGCGGLSLVALGLLGGGLLAVRRPLGPADVASGLLSGLVVAALEEGLFRGALLGALRRRLPWRPALLFLSLLFAALHFLRPDPAHVRTLTVDWASGLRLVPQLFWQFGDPQRLASGCGTLLCVGWTLGYTVVRTGSLHLAIGLHAGWVLVMKLLGAATRLPRPTAWLGDDLRSGLAPALAVLGTLALLRPWLRQRQARLP